MIIHTDERWLLPDGTLVGASTPFVLNDIQYLNGVVGLSDKQQIELGIVKMSDTKNDLRYGPVVPDLNAPGKWQQQQHSWDVLKPALLAHAAARRYDKEVGGISIAGAQIKTDRESQAMIAGAYAFMQDGPQKVLKFKTAAGFVDLDAKTIATIARAVGDHIQKCFEQEAEVAAKIEAEQIKTFEAIDEMFASMGTSDATLRV